MAIYEIRHYQVYPGKMEEWLKLMEESIIPFVVSHGAEVTASFTHQTDDCGYVWIRRFDNESHKQQVYEKVYESDHWKTVLSPLIGELLDRKASVIIPVVPTKSSALQ